MPSLLQEHNLIGLDYGDKTVGVAFCAKGTTVAVGVEIIRRDRPTKLRKTLSRIATLCKERKADGIILGYPLHLDGREGLRCEKTKDFADALIKRTGLSVTLWDERLTSVEAEEQMAEDGLRPEEFKAHVDEIAAMLILQDYLNTKYGNG